MRIGPVSGCLLGPPIKTLKAWLHLRKRVDGAQGRGQGTRLCRCRRIWHTLPECGAGGRISPAVPTNT